MFESVENVSHPRCSLSGSKDREVLPRAVQDRPAADVRASELRPRPLRCGRVLVPLSRDVPARHRHSNPVGFLGRISDDMSFMI